MPKWLHLVLLSFFLLSVPCLSLKEKELYLAGVIKAGKFPTPPPSLGQALVTLFLFREGLCRLSRQEWR